MHQKNILKSPQNHGLCYNVAWDYRGNRGDLLLTDVVVAVVVVVVCFYCCCCWCCCLFSWMWLALLSSPTCACIRWCYSPSSALMKIILQGPVFICSTMFNVNYSCGLWSFRKLALNILNVDEEHLDYYEWERWGIFFQINFSSHKFFLSLESLSLTSLSETLIGQPHLLWRLHGEIKWGERGKDCQPVCSSLDQRHRWIRQKMVISLPLKGSLEI